jgi:tetratricopeptide (TPR) repeat protein
LFGYALEPGTAGFIVFLAILFFASAYMLRDRAKLIRALAALFISLSVVAVFVLIKILSHGSWLTFNTFFGNTGNPVGAWTDLTTVFGLLSLLSVFAMEMLPISGRARLFTKVLYVISIILLVILNFSTAWLLVLGSSIVLLIYFATVEKREEVGLKKRSGVQMATLLMVISLLFVFNPKIGGKSLSNIVSDKSGVVSSDVRPNLSSTIVVGRSVIAKSPVLGSGPNTFDRDWLLYKSKETNATPFWNVAFPFGFGFLPTALASVGLLGLIVWALFFVFFLILGAKALSKNSENRSDKFLLTSTFLMSLYLWIATFIYSPSLVIIALAFVSTGLFVAAAEATGVIASKEIFFNRSKLTLFGSYLIALVLIVGMGVLSFVSIKKIIAATHFQKALVYSNTSGKTLDEIESELGKAITVSPSDPFWSAVSQVELSRANAVLNNPTSNTQTDQQTFQNAVSASIGAMQNAISLNPTYNNWIALGNIYASLVAEPLSVNGAYESAQNSYKMAEALHPLSPEVSLLMAKLEYFHKNAEGARKFVSESLTKKPDYADAYFFLSELEVSQNNLRQAIDSAQTGALLSPTNPGVFFQLGLLKYMNKDYSGALEAFNKALALVPNYANAQYYLGLTLDKLGKKADALKQFELLQKTNPNNPAVADAIQNLEAGRPAASDSSSASTKKSLPISGQ